MLVINENGEEYGYSKARFFRLEFAKPRMKTFARASST